MTLTYKCGNNTAKLRTRQPYSVPSKSIMKAQSTILDPGKTKKWKYVKYCSDHCLIRDRPVLSLTRTRIFTSSFCWELVDELWLLVLGRWVFRETPVRVSTCKSQIAQRLARDQISETLAGKQGIYRPAVPILFASRSAFQERNSSRSTIVALLPKARMCIFGCFYLTVFFKLLVFSYSKSTNYFSNSK